MAKVMILAAGLGTRLAPLTDELPKPLVPLGDRPLLVHLAEKLKLLNIPSFALNVHYLPDKFNNTINDLRITVHVMDESRIRGTAGGIAGARGVLGPPPIIAWNGDVLVDPPLDALFAAAGRAGLAFAVAPRPAGVGTVGVSADARIVRLRGESFGTEAFGGDYVGIAGIGGETLAALPDFGCLIGDVALPLLREGRQIAAVPVTAPWTDVGSLAAYHRANLEWLAARGEGDHSWVHPSATVGTGVRLVASLVGDGAVVEGDGLVERTVVWPGARARAPLSDAIVTTLGRVVGVS